MNVDDENDGTRTLEFVLAPRISEDDMLGAVGVMLKPAVVMLKPAVVVPAVEIIEPEASLPAKTEPKNETASDEPDDSIPPEPKAIPPPVNLKDDLGDLKVST